jgi:hypothetical protein
MLIEEEAAAEHTPVEEAAVAHKAVGKEPAAVWDTVVEGRAADIEEARKVAAEERKVV